ncbi:unnamed protein product [Sphenostylis stenocarpa]|uniref:Clp protease n=1 Tax=Sphenostylis stenocarpa TaxID=92480 RepID=A0AA86SF44_9FABA|nr:unnamed protein product [Sphenostylis stenocarpa]
MIHQPASSYYEAQAGEFILEAEELLKIRETITRVYVQRTGKPFWVITEDMERDVFMSAAEAQTHGIIDLVAKHKTANSKRHKIPSSSGMPSTPRNVYQGALEFE